MQESILTDIDQDVKERINYLVYIRIGTAIAGTLS